LFSIAAGKRGVYLLPLYPAIALVAADWLAPHAARRRLLAPGLALLASCACLATVAVLHEKSDRPLRAVADDVAEAVPSTASIAARPSVSENDRLVLAYRIGRTLPRRGPNDEPTEFVIVASAFAATAGAGCSPRVTWHDAAKDGLVLLACASA